MLALLKSARITFQQLHEPWYFTGRQYGPAVVFAGSFQSAGAPGNDWAK